MKIETKTLMVSPQQAKRWLDSFNTQNRTIRDTQVRQFVEDMKNKRWVFTHQGIAFYEDGTLADGQHRLAAVVEANTPIKFMVTTGLPKATAQTIDQGRARMAHDAIRISGAADWISKNTVSIARFLMSEMGEVTMPHSINNILNFAERHKEPIQLVESMTATKKRYFTHSGICANYVCALVAGVPEEKVKRFAQVMYTGEITNSSENAAIRLREFLIANPGCWIGSSRVETSKRTQRALEAFANGQSLAKLYMPPELTYPTPR